MFSLFMPCVYNSSVTASAQAPSCNGWSIYIKEYTWLER